MKILMKIKQLFKKLQEKILLYIQKFTNHYTMAEDEEFIDDTKSSMLTKVTPIANAIIYIIIAFFVIILLWITFSQIDVIVTADGKVIPSTKVKLIQTLDGGIVKQILVDEGTMVKKNQPLIILDNTRYKADYERSYQKQIALEASIARLTAETQGKSKIIFPDFIVKNYPDVAQREIDLFLTRQITYQQELNNYQLNYKVAKNELATYADAYKEGIVSKIDYLRNQRMVYEAEQKILELTNKHSEEIKTALVQANNDLDSLNEELKGLQDKMKRTTLLSPVAGIVKKINVTSQYEAVSPFMTIMEVLPLEDTLLIQIKVKPADIAFVHLDQKAYVQLTTYDYSIYGGLQGKVEYISPDAIEETKPLEKNLASYYLVNIRTAKNYLGTNKNKLPVFAGMDAHVKIITGTKSIMHYLIKPLVKAKEEALRER